MAKHGIHYIPAFVLLLSLLGLHACSRDYDVRDFGAVGDGVTLDTEAINSAIGAAASKGGGTIHIPAGTYAVNSIHLASHITLELEAGATLLAVEGNGFDSPEPGPEPQYQDFGHSHWHNAMMWGENLQDICICGKGIIDGAALSAGFGDSALKGGVADKAISLKNCKDVTLADITMYRCGHFALLATGVDNLVIEGLTVDTNRDGLDIDCCRNVVISGCRVNSPKDDGIVLKASYALGRYVDTEDVSISDCELYGYAVGSMLDGTFRRDKVYKDHYWRSCGRVKLGTETSGGFRNIEVRDCTFDYCGGLYIESMDGGIVEDISATNLTMKDCTDSPIFIRLGKRMRSPEGKEVGRIRRISISNLTAVNTDPHYGCILAGIPDRSIEDVTLSNISLNFEGGLSPEEAMSMPQELEDEYPDPWMFSGADETRDTPMVSSGMFLRHIDGLVMEKVDITYNIPDSRPSIIRDDVSIGTSCGTSCSEHRHARQCPLQ